MKSKFTTNIAIMLIVVFTSCVSSKKYKSLEAQSQKLQSDLSTCDNSLKSTNTKVADLNKQVTNLSNQNSSLSREAEAYRKLKAEMKARENELNAALAEQEKAMKEIRERIITGLSELANSGIEIEFKNGLLYVNLPEQLLFRQGSATLDKKSKNALSPLASVLNHYPNVQIYVVGHTDSLKIHTTRFQDNWSLSTERANSIVRVFRDNYGVDPTRLLSAGRSRYNPSASNETKEGRALNRRIQIILNPDLARLWAMMDEKR